LDIQALRALAVLYAIGFHLWPNRLPGGFTGVDVFFVISGFLITSHMVEQFNNGSFKVSVFWGRRIRRLLPAAFTVLILSAIASYFLQKDSDKLTVFPEYIASTFYFQNWMLALNAVDYLGQENALSPVQHYWSLSVEEQFYIGLPILLLLVYLISRMMKKTTFINLAKNLLILLLISSLIYSIYLSSADPKIAFFSTFTRIWEFALGALVIFLPKPDSLSKRLTSSLLAFSVIGLLASAFVINSYLPYPSFYAALPAISAALFIWVGVSSGSFAKLISLKPIQHIGDISYSAYLWHWPLVVLIPEYTNTELTTLQKLLIFVATIVLASFSRKFIEKPFIDWGHRNSRADVKTFIAVALVSAAITAASLAVVSEAKAKIEDALNQVQSLGIQKCFGAQARLADGTLCTNDKILAEFNPPLDAVANDSAARLFPQCHMPSREDVIPKVCELGDRNGSVRIVVSGDSHANHFIAMADSLGKANGWAIDTLAKGGCPLSYLQRVHEPELTKGCIDWANNAIDFIKKGNYDLLITSSGSGSEYISGDLKYPNPVIGFSETWKEIADSGTRILVVKDNPKPIAALPSCISANPKNYIERCSVARAKAFDYDPLVEAVAKLKSPKVKLLNLDDVYCGPKICEPVIGKVIVYRDDNHLTSTFANSLQTYFAKAISPLLKDKIKQ